MPNNATVIVALLRQPHMERPTEMRSDPFWEFGSFGLTGCHKTNLMHPKKVHELAGARIAFVQGGKAGFKLVCATPPVTPTAYADRSQISWDATTMPLRYEVAPVIISPEGYSDVPQIVEIFENVRRNGWMGRFASKFRTRRIPLPDKCGQQLLRVWRKRLDQAVPSDFARSYTEALPYNPPKTDCDRQGTFDKLLAQAMAI
ncbi:MAG: hypothetical protein JSS83_11365 [Cyanobacteria bacterium SZAS LIN-3]|nr:hypothetical protein [Cyanobacteria bacterium SZAS LIN-3]